MLVFPQVINVAFSTFFLEIYKISLSELLGLLPTGIWAESSKVAFHLKFFQTVFCQHKKSPFHGCPQKGDQYQHNSAMLFVIYVIVRREMTKHKMLKS